MTNPHLSGLFHVLLSLPQGKTAQTAGTKHCIICAEMLGVGRVPDHITKVFEELNPTYAASKARPAHVWSHVKMVLFNRAAQAGSTQQSIL